MKELYRDVDFWNKVTERSYDEMRKELEGIFGKRLNLLSETHMRNLYFMNFLGNHDRPSSEKPDWLDREKFRKGQRFARDNIAGLFLGQLYGLSFLLCHDDSLRSIITTQKSHTPYLAFKRYLSTGQRVRNWYTEDPWCEGTKAYEDIQTVKRMHLDVSTKVNRFDYEEMESKSTIRNPHCPALRFITDDFSTILPPESLSAHLYAEQSKHLRTNSNAKRINQSEMGYTLFGFMGLPVLFPDHFGIYPRTDEDLENFCYVWRCIGYLLGIDEEMNICRGSLEDVKARCRSYIEDLAKPAFQRLEPQWEHMMRCVVEGNLYFMNACNFETIVLCIADIMGIEMPIFYSSLTYSQRIRYYLHKYFIRYGLKYSFVRSLVNKLLNSLFDKALYFDDTKIVELKKKSTSSPLHVPLAIDAQRNADSV
ncbi:uncharacterized protein LOC122634021 [Vespula pensylvanica]|uniref:uncharacterized protein LOC122634021 n=1 Tax=Vespula pensylvanica TaxID=30213 RepID=UPI001CBA2829|nr:uncharacterized protein LOC122634021 [Vespula pensylvanica]